jgi:hypothetical protein
MTITVWTWPELCELAGSPGQARGQIRDKQVWRVLQGVYAGAEHPDGPEVRLAALAKILPADVALAGRAALWVLGVDVLALDGTLDVALPRGRNLRPRQGLAFHAMEVPDSELVEVGRLLVVSPARVVIDAGRTEHLVEAVALGDAALRAGVTTFPLLEESLDRAGGLRGVVKARALTQHLEPRSESPMESRLRMTLVLGGIERPEAQVDFYDEDGTHKGRADLYLDGVVFEYDGFVDHTEKVGFGKERQRGNGLSDGLEVRRFSSYDYHVTPRSLIIGTALRALRAARDKRPTLVRGPDTLRPPRLVPPVTRDQVRAQRPPEAA